MMHTRSSNRSAGLRRARRMLSAQAGFAALAATLAALPQTAMAQFAATPQVEAGSVSVVANDSIVVVETPFAQIRWTPEPGTGDIDFLPASNTVTFWDGGQTGEFTVLNRIIPSDLSRRAVFSGEVNSLVGNARGGTVWFYSPGGILVNSSGVFDVGNLLLSAGSIEGNFPLDDGLSTAAPAFEGTLSIDADPGSTASVTNLGLLRTGGYAALLGPRVSQAGLVRSGGTVALVAAQSAVLTVGFDLFDIQVTVAPYTNPEGPSDNLVLSHTGETISSADEGAGAHRVFLATMASVDPLAVLLGGSVQATDAAVTANGIVLSTGGGIADGVAVGSTSPRGRVDVTIDAAPPAQPPDPAGDVYPHLTDGGIEIDATGSILVRPGATVLSGGDIDIRSAVDIDIGGNARLIAGYDGQGSGALDPDANLSLTATGNISGGGILEGAGSIDLLATEIALDGASVTNRNPGGVTALAEEGDLAIGSLDVNGLLDVNALGDVSLGTVEVAGGPATVESIDGGITLGTVSAEGADFTATAPLDIVLEGNALTAGTITISTPGTFRTLADAATLQANGAIMLPDVAATGALSVISSAGPVLLGGAVDATGSLLVDSGSGVNVAGVLDAPTIEIASADILVGANGGIGTGTGTVLLRAANPNGVVLGGTDTDQGGYLLDQVELGRIRGTQVTLADSLSSGILVGDAPISASNIGVLRLQTGDSITVTGALAMNGAGDANGLELVAGQRIDVITPSGSIAVLDASGGLAGSLLLDANNILVADAQTYSLSLGNPLFAEREVVLADGGSQPVPAGFVSAGSMDLRVGQTLHVRNTGTATRFGGLNARAFSITATGESPADVIVYGRQQEASGGFVDDFRLLRLVTLAGQFTPESAINGCRISAGSCENPVVVTGPTIDAIVDPDGQGPLAAVPRTPSIQLLDMTQLDFADDPLVTEPVTGAGSFESAISGPVCVEEGDTRCP